MRPLFTVDFNFFRNTGDRDTASTCKEESLRQSIDDAGLEVVRCALELLLYDSVPRPSFSSFTTSKVGVELHDVEQIIRWRIHIDVWVTWVFAFHP